MVAIAIFAVGMLGMLGLLTNSLSWSYSANHSTRAAMLAYQMADHVRGNVTQFVLYNDPINSSTANCFNATGCTATQMVQSEFSAWSAKLAEALPGGQGAICRDTSPTDGDPSGWLCDDSTGPAPLVVKICWYKTQSGGAWACYHARV